MLNGLNDEQLMNLAFIGSCIKGTAHNINTPLSAIMGRSEMLLMRFNRIKEKLGIHVEIDEIDRFLRDISLVIENSNRITDTIKNVMQKSINAGSYQVQSLNIAKILMGELEFLKSDMEFKHDIEKEYKISQTIPIVEGIYVHFSNSFLEILENSKQAMSESENRKLTVSVTSKEKFIEVKFHDTGCGIENRNVEKLLFVLQNPFEPLQSHDESKMGISRVARLLKPYNAQFDIQSKPGDTMFAIKFPI